MSNEELLVINGLADPAEYHERMARALITSCGGDPDMLVQPGTPNVYGTPGGEVFAVTPDAAVPLWRFYLTAGKKALEIAEQMRAPTGLKKDAAA